MMEAPPTDNLLQKTVSRTSVTAGGNAPASGVAPGAGCLVQIYPVPDRTELISLDEPEMMLGRDEFCDIPLQDASVSRRHALIRFDETGYRVSDQGSTNGVFVDDVPTQGEVPLVGDELIRLGNVSLRFLSRHEEEAAYYARVDELITRDNLTGLYNRSYILPLLRKSVQSELPTSVLLLDIDHFKTINDTSGHLIGDEVLRLFCERLTSCLESEDVAGRIGGEEFIVVSRGRPSAAAAELAEQIRGRIAAQPLETTAGPVSVTCSIGVTTAAAPDTAPEKLISDADARLYKAKNSGRNRVCSGDG